MNGLRMKQVAGGLAAAVLLAASFGTAARAAVPLFAQPPSWWDSVRVRVERADTPEASLKKSATLPENQTPRDRLAGWNVLGPLDNRQGNALNDILPGEDSGLRMAVPGKDGQQVSWQLWKDPEKRPFSDKLDNFAALFQLDYATSAPGRKWLLVDHSGGIVLRVNGRQVYRRSDRSQGETPVPAVLSLSNRIFVKLNQPAGAWKLNISVLPEHPAMRPIRLQSEIIRLYADADPAGCVPLALRTAQGYDQLNDTVNALFWYQFVLDNQADERTAVRVVSDVAGRLNDPDQAEAALPFLRRAALNGKLPVSARRQAVMAAVDQMINLYQYNEGLDFLGKNEAALKPLLDVRWSVLLAKLNIYRGDADKAKEYLKAVNEEGLDRDVKQMVQPLRHLIAGMKKNLLQLPRDLDYDIVLREAALRSKESTPNSLVDYIRKILLEKNGQLLDAADDPGLLTGAANRYREAFAPYAAVYEPDIRQYAALLTKKFGYTEGRARDEVARLSLQSSALSARTPPALPPLAETAAGVGGAARRSFLPVAALPPGVLERRLATFGMDEDVVTPPPGYACQYRGSVFFQNSRQLCRVDRNTVVWKTGFENSTFAQTENSRPLGGGFSPKTDGRRVYARLVEKGRFVVVAADIRDGVGLWSWESPGVVVCSDPVLWENSVLFLASRPEAINRYYLVVLQADTGQLDYELLLCSTSPEISLGPGGGGNLLLDVFMPEPAVRNGMAFINTNLGVAAAVNLRGRNLEWVRTYQRLPFGLTPRLSGLAFSRSLCPPVPGNDAVLFAPLDAPGLLLLDQKTGRIRKELTRLNWADCRGAGADTALVVHADGGATALSLKDLAPAYRCDGQDVRVLRSCADGVFLVRDGVLEAWPENGRGTTGSLRLPSTFVPLYFDGAQCWGFQPGGIASVVGVLVDDAGSAPAARVAALEPKIEWIQNGTFREDGKDVFVMADNYLLRLDETLAPAWSFPAPEGGSFHVAKSCVYAVGRAAVYMLDRASGLCVRTYPAPGEAPVGILAAGVVQDALWFGTRTPDGQAIQIFSLGREGVRSRGMVANKGAGLYGIFATGELLVHDDGKLRTYKAGEGGLFKPAGAGLPFPALSNNYYKRGSAKIAMPPDNILLFTQKQAVLASGGGKLTPIPLRNWNISGGNENRKFGSDSATLVESDLAAIQVAAFGCSLVDAARGVDLAETVQFRSPPSVLRPGLLAGAMAREMENSWQRPPLVIGLFDREKKALLSRKSPDVDRGSGGPMDYDASFLVNGTAVHLFRSINWQAPPAAAASLDDLRPASPLTTCPFPAYRTFSGAVVRGGRILMLLDNRPVRMTTTQFMSLLTGKGEGMPPVLETECRLDLQVQVDGFLDEWDPKRFAKVQGGEVAAAWGANMQIYLACRITSPDMVRILAERGAEGRLQVHVLPAGRAGFNPATARSDGFVGEVGEKGEDWDISWAVAPDASSLTVEARIPYAKLTAVDPARLRVTKNRELRGDFAFDFQSGGIGSLSQSVTGSQPVLPVLYPRLLLKFK